MLMKDGSYVEQTTLVRQDAREAAAAALGDKCVEQYSSHVAAVDSR